MCTLHCAYVIRCMAGLTQWRAILCLPCSEQGTKPPHAYKQCAQRCVCMTDVSQHKGHLEYSNAMLCLPSKSKASLHISKYAYLMVCVCMTGVRQQGRHCAVPQGHSEPALQRQGQHLLLHRQLQHSLWQPEQHSFCRQQGQCLQ